MSDSQMKPGPELDALVAEKVFGWTRLEWSGQNPASLWDDKAIFDAVMATGHNHIEGKVPPYSTSIADAWEVLPKLHRLNYVVYINPSSLGGGYVECFYPGHDAEDSFPEFFGVCGQQVPHAICLAGLVAVGELK